MKREMTTTTKRLTNKQKKIVRQSSTPGSSKGAGCVADRMMRYFAKRSRSYKHEGYQGWLQKTRKLNK